MFRNEDVRVAQRRRGVALEEALLDATWEELVEKGYDGLTIEAVADRAQTSRAVIYRRWPTKPDLVLAALAHQRKKERIEVPDTGSVREDLIEVLRRLGLSRARLGIAVAIRMGGYFSDTGSSMTELRAMFVAGGGPALDTILARAVERGEIVPAKLTPRVAALPYDLYRAEVMMTLKPVPDAVIESIVDEVFLPLVRPTSCEAC